MTKSADYRTVARGLAPYWIRARLMNDETLGTHLYRALEQAIFLAKRWAEAEEQLKQKGS